MSTGLMATILAACGSASKTGSAATASSSSSATTGSSTGAGGTPVKGGTIKLAIQTPTAAINPLTISDPGGLCLIGQVGEFLTFDNYNAIIVPKGTDYGSYQKSDRIGTGPFKLNSDTENQQAEFVANPDSWGGAPNLASTTFIFYNSSTPQITALQGGQVDGIVLMPTAGAEGILHSSSYTVNKLKSSIHRELSMAL